MNEQEYIKLKRQFKAEYERRLEALEIVYQASRQSASWVNDSKLGEITADRSVSLDRTPTLLEAIKGVLVHLPGHFNINNVISLVEEYYPEIKRPINPTSVSGSLRTLHKQAVLKIIESGRGTKPTTYSVSRKEGREREG